MSAFLCHDCYLELPWNRHACERCAHPLEDKHAKICGQCLQKPQLFDHAISPLRYEKPIKQLIVKFKAGDVVCGNILANQFLDTQPLQRYPICYVPMHKSALQKRGFNQAQHLAKWLAKHWQLPLLDILQCRHPHIDQKLLTAAQRRINLRDSFAVKNSDRLPDRLILVDDVMTTGTTLNTLSKLLKQQGVKTINVVCLARTPAPRIC
jgi:ComF family protein